MTAAQITKTYQDSSFDILTLPVDVARAHVKNRTVAADHFGITKIGVRIGRVTHTWTSAAGWSSVTA